MPLSKAKALKILERAQFHLARQEFADAEKMLREIADAKVPQVAGFLGEAVMGQGRDEEALSLWRQELEKDPKDPELNARYGTALSQKGRYAEALPYLEHAQAEKRKDWGTLIHLSYALFEQERLDDAEKAIGKALQLGAGAPGKLILAVIRGRQGRYADAVRLTSEVEAGSSDPDLVCGAQSIRADALLLQGEAANALALWKQVRERGRLEPVHLAHMAYAAQLCGEAALAEALSEERLKQGPLPEDLLLFAQIANLRSQPEPALEWLVRAEQAQGARHPGFAFEVAATRGRALRLSGRRDEAKEILSALVETPEASSARLGPKVEVDLGHLAAEEGDFETAARHFETALRMDAEDPEAKRALELTRRRVAWREEVSASAEAKVEAARAEAEALRRRFSQREGELETLRAELEKLKAAQQDALEKARRAEEDARAQQQRKLREELTTRERDADEKGQQNIEGALGEASSQCPAPVLHAFLVAEKTFQRALYSDLPAAAVVVLYTGALERALYTFFVECFRVWLKEKGRLADFLKAAVRERRGTRVEYFDHFVEAFDEERPGRAPSMGEVGRVLERRKEPYLRAFDQFLSESWALPDAYFDELAAFVQWSKTELRDPVAHGRSDAVSYDKLRKFRERVLDGGLLKSLVGVSTSSA